MACDSQAIRKGGDGGIRGHPLRAANGLALRVDGSKGTSKRGEYLFEYRLAPENGGTEVTLHGAIRGLGGLAALISKLFVGSFKKACVKDLQALAAHLASPADAPPPPNS